MATRFFTRSLLTTKQTISSVFSRSYTSLSLSTPPSSLSTSSILRLRPLVAVAAHFHRLSPAATSIRGYATRQTSSSLNDPNPNPNRPPIETILLDGYDFKHWIILMEKPEGDPTRDEIIDSYIKTLATVVGSEEEARMKIYSVSTRHYFGFGALVSEELSYKIKELPRVRLVLPDSHLDVRNKDYGAMRFLVPLEGEPFINGRAVPYDPKYHEEWMRNNVQANPRNRRKDESNEMLSQGFNDHICDVHLPPELQDESNEILSQGFNDHICDVHLPPELQDESDEMLSRGFNDHICDVHLPPELQVMKKCQIHVRETWTKKESRNYDLTGCVFKTQPDSGKYEFKVKVNPSYNYIIPEGINAFKDGKDIIVINYESKPTRLLLQWHKEGFLDPSLPVIVDVKGRIEHPRYSNKTVVNFSYYCESPVTNLEFRVNWPKDVYKVEWRIKGNNGKTIHKGRVWSAAPKKRAGSATLIAQGFIVPVEAMQPMAVSYQVPTPLAGVDIVTGTLGDMPLTLDTSYIITEVF